jgi:hypothetical protein
LLLHFRQKVGQENKHEATAGDFQLQDLNGKDAKPYQALLHEEKKHDVTGRRGRFKMWELFLLYAFIIAVSILSLSRNLMNRERSFLADRFRTKYRAQRRWSLVARKGLKNLCPTTPSSPSGSSSSWTTRSSSGSRCASRSASPRPCTGAD